MQSIELLRSVHSFGSLHCMHALPEVYCDTMKGPSQIQSIGTRTEGSDEMPKSKWKAMG
jgi:hypothetical protein